ncbi:MAG: efflux RND transporter periplasmic adaptor subunit [Candidatus Brocadiales bacterium]
MKKSLYLTRQGLPGPFYAGMESGQAHFSGHSSGVSAFYARSSASPFRHFYRALLILAVIFAMSLPKVAMGEYKPRKGEIVRPVEAFRAVTQDVVYMAETTGSLIAEADVDLRSELDGIVQKIFFEEGDEVEEGEALISLEDEKYRLKVAESEAKARKAEADMTLARKTLKRMIQLYEDGVISSQDYDDAVSKADLTEATRDTALATLELARKDLKDTQIIAPISGIVSKRFVDVGEYITEGTTDLLNIVDIDPIKLVFTVPAKYFSYVSIGQKVNVSIDAYPDEEFIGEVYYLNPKIIVETRRFQCYARIPNPDNRLSPGFFVIVRLPVATHPDAVVIPEEAVLSEEGVSYCFRVEDGRATKSIITPGIRLKGGMLEVVEGLKSGDYVVVRGQYVLVDGDRVEAGLFKLTERE